MPIARTAPAAVNFGTALDSRAASATVGAQSNEVSSSTANNITDIVAKWAIALGVITPSTITRVDVYVWGTNDDNSYPGYQGGSVEVITGVAGAITISVNGLAALRPLKSTLAHTASQTVQDEASIVQALGYVPRKWGLVIINNTGAALAASGHSAEYVETYYN